MGNTKWRFPASGGGLAKGLSTGDVETFKGRPYQAFAKEILQNSIDAKKDKGKPVIVEFKTFSLKTADIPGVDDLKAAMRRCIEYWHFKEDYVSTYSNMVEMLERDTITCLRISDYNTKGLIGVEKDQDNSGNFFALTKGSGVSKKDTTSAGGSKGVGKNAAIQMSEIRTVFYSTHTCESLDGTPQEHVGSIGFADFVSGYVDDNTGEERDKTQGTGFYSISDLNKPLQELSNLEPTYSLRESETGTDIYILGFEGENNWAKEVLNSVLDSFMVAIVRNDLKIELNGITISNETIDTLIENSNIIQKSNYASFVSQYRMLNGIGDVKTYDITTEYGDCSLYIIPFSNDEEALATHKCTMVRHPYMKIKNFDLGASFRVSALCIIEESPLGTELREIENPEHNDWQPKRIKNVSKRKEIEVVINDIRSQIRDAVIDCLQMGDMEPLEPSGAGDYLPDVGDGDGTNTNTSDESKKISEKTSVSPLKENKTTDKNTRQPSSTDSGLEPDIGEPDDNGDNVSHPTGHNTSSGGGNHPGNGSGGARDGDQEIFKRAFLSGVKYNVISTNKNEGKLRIVFTSPIDHENCYLQIRLLDDDNKKTEVAIESMQFQGADIGSADIDGYGPFTIKRNEKISLDITTSRKGFFASEVKVICK